MEPVYPRACGGTIAYEWRNARMQGLSPRLRGNHLPVAGEGHRVRSIPAPAGEPRSRGRRSGGTWVYLSLSRVIRTVVSTIIRTP